MILKKVLKVLFKLIRNLLLLLFFCEFLIYYVVLYQCQWKKVNDEQVDDGLKTMLLADTHMLGPIRGHWLDKLRREWQMQRTFQTAVQIFSPDVIFILGDIFDEGNWVNEDDYKNYVDRFHKLFKISDDIKLYAIHGNHDINFHYATNQYLIQRFNNAFNTSGVNLITEKKTMQNGKQRSVHFVTVNSVAMEGDHCRLCNQAEYDLKKIGSKLKCFNGTMNCNSIKKLDYSQPIVLQHFPTYRVSDEDCLDKNSINLDKYREKWDTLSLESTKFLGKQLEPRAFFSGHSHHNCRIKNSLGIDEYTIASFNWRNINNPSFLLTVFSDKDYTVSKCDSPKETTVICCYVVGVILSLVLSFIDIRILKLYQKFRNIFSKRRINYKEL
ncbi:unnamed protein product [Diamesa tonsa]